MMALMPEGDADRAVSRASGPTALVTGVNVLAFVAMLLSGGRGRLGSIPTGTLMRFGASYGPLVCEGQLFRLVTSVFLHLNPAHLLLNSLALLSIGPTVERDYGRARFVAIYLLSGIAGAAFSVLAHHADPVVSAGASGAICGAIAASLVRAARERRLPESRALLIWAGATLVFGVLIHADNAAHLGGLIFGALLGLVFGRAGAKSTESSAWPSAFLLVLALGAFAFAIRARDRSETASELVNRGVDLARGDDDEGAIVAYRRALELEPDDATAHYDLGIAFERRDRFDEAIRHFARALELEPSDTRRHALAGAYVNQGVTLARKGKTLEAIAAYRSALEIEEANANTHRNLGLALNQAGDHAAAIRELRRALELSASSENKSALAAVLIDEGTALVQSGKRDAGIAELSEAVELWPDDWHSHYALGRALIPVEPARAVKELERAWSLDHSELTQSALRDALEARRDARADGGDLGGALDDLEAATLLGFERPNDGGPPPRPDAARPP
jgi:membrane associated rhomboid family serine protease/Flp pilus assembly protein TadD